jgi:L,D-peptidoglycan transpeptidase YkuD (ErfK/YbiS/YcfS/YnhG family)
MKRRVLRADHLRMRRHVLRLATVLAALVPLAALGAVPAQAWEPKYDARQIVVVSNRSWTSTYAEVRAYEKRSDGRWVTKFGPWPARIGRNGFGSPKREGDGQTPVGSFPMKGVFGVRSNPGTRYPWLKVDGASVWVDDPDSTYYNRYMRNPANGRWGSAEKMYVPGPYDYAGVIGYNMPATAGYGSGIFLHVGTGGSTAGCVSVTASQVVAILRWLDPAKKPRFIMGPESVIG